MFVGEEQGGWEGRDVQDGLDAEGGERAIMKVRRHFCGEIEDEWTAKIGSATIQN